MIKKPLQYCLLSLFLLFSINSYAVMSPVKMLSRLSNNMITGLKKNRSKLSSNPRVVSKLVRKYLLPKVDVERLSSYVVGRSWRSASANQRGQFKKRFIGLVIGTYSSALQSYDGDVVHFYPLRVNYFKKRSLVVRSVISRKSGQTISVDYYVVRSGNSWKIYDFTIENVSMAASYRAQFQGIVSQGGMPLLLSRLRGK